MASSSHPPVPAELSEVDDTDDISLTSTNNGDDDEEDKEWFVDQLLAERPHPEIPGETQYLISWEGFPMDECTWEPAGNLGPGLLVQWEDTKKDIKKGKKKAFDVEIFNVAYREKEERRERRNAKRKRLGLLAPRQPLSPESHVQKRSPSVLKDGSTLDTALDPAFSEEAQEMDDVDSGLAPSKTKPQEAEEVVTPKTPLPTLSTPSILPTKPTPSTLPGYPAPSTLPEKPRVETTGTPNANKKKPARTQTPILPPKPPKQPKEAKRTASSDGTASTTKTGYQGTARKPSADKNAASSKASSSKAPNQKTPASTPKISSLPPPKLSSSLANKFGVKKHTATRTKPQTAAPPKRTSNVFIGGKEQKKRASLVDAMDDPSKAPKAFSSMRVMNIAKKRGIERNDMVHPSLASIPPSFIITNDRSNGPNADQTKTNAPSAPSEPPSLVQSPTEISPTNGPISGPKVKKSVRFMEAQDVMREDVPEDVSMTDAMNDTVDHSVGGLDSVGRPAESPVSASVPAPARRLSLASYQERGQAQVVAKAAVFGKAGSKPVRVLFSGITRQSQPWLSTFIAQETLNFSAVCASYNFIPYKPNLVQEILSTGAIETNSNEIGSTLANIAEHLRRGSSGSHLVTEQFSILVYPSNCDGWKGLGVDNHNSVSPLRHVIYKAPVDRRLYPPISIPRAPARLSHTKEESHCQILIKDLFRLDFSRLLPQKPEQKDKQVFMLLFPEREAQVCNMMKLWLRSCQPNCRIFSNELRDSWVKFNETVRAGAAGTIILHEDVSVAIRQLPRTYQLLDNKRCYTFWNLATGQYDPPRFPSDVDTTIEPGTLQMTRLFPHGRAFLITPSFALSDPIRLCQFLDWFKNYCVNPHYLIMACADFPGYLKDITLEKARESERMHASNKGEPRLEEMLADFGLSETDLKARFRSWEILKEIMANFGDEETNEEIRKVEWITDFIDPNDEQSLVNYFCWWSTLKCDQYRKFTVLGSSNNRNRAAYRHIEIPAYTRETVSDPDVALVRDSKQRQAKEAIETGGHINGVGQGSHTTPGYADTRSIPTTPVSRTLSDFESVIFKNDSAAEIRMHITSIFKRFKPANWARLHANAVSWLNVSMADHLGDPRCEYDTFKNWLGKSPVFGRVMNTWYGLFYTIDKDWNPKASPNTYGRHPWIAVIRPVDPHLSPKRYEKMELFFWDLSCRDRERDQGRSSLLLDMQRGLIDVVKQEIPFKNSRYYLDRVYVSCTTHQEFSSSDHPLDVTYRRLEEMLSNSKTWLPPFGGLLYDRGWTLLPETEWQRDTTAESSDLLPAAQLLHEPPPSYDNDNTKFRRSVWHAPRPKAKGAKSKCGNHLFEAASEARRQNSSRQMMRYQYKSTLDWYHDMKMEGRDASHVNVDSADKILPRLIHKK
ncbi:hypothetical protein F4804DRAFT_321048 [Jackrogersella minutella]|nr:hypothetical protein F4804DRAFT_321048 [Jackrogersella minutella]